MALAAPVEVVRPRLRADVKLRRQVLAGEVFYIVRHPDSQQFYRFREHEAALIRLLDGNSTISEIARRFTEESGLGVAREETVETFVESLRGLDLVERSAGERNIALYERLRRERARRRLPFADLLFIKKKIYDPDRFFAWVLRWLGFCWTPTFIKISLAAALVAAGLVAVEWPRFVGDFKTFAASFSDPSKALANYLFVLGNFFWIAIIHESCHGVTCKRFGGEVHEVGFLLFYLQFPGAYTNVNDAWGFEKRSQRIWVTLAGAYSELVLTTLAIFLWWVVPQGSFLHREALIVVTLGFLSNLFGDFNPLVKFDGYYILSDYLEVPNLQGNSWSHVGYLFRRHLLRLPVDPLPATKRTRRIYLTYGILSFTYITVLMTGLLFFLGRWLQSSLGAPGLVLFAIPALAILRRPAGAISSTAKFFWSDKRETLTSPGGRRAVLLILLFLAVLAFLPVLPLTVSGEGQVEPSVESSVRTVAPGRVVEVFAIPGEIVVADQALLRLTNPTLRRQLAVEEARLEEIGAAIRQAEAERRLAAAELSRSEREEVGKTVDRLRLLVQGLSVVAPAAGTLDTPELGDLVGRVLAEGELLGRILGEGAPRVRIRVPERLLKRIRTGLPARLKTPAHPARQFHGRVVMVAPERAPNDAGEMRAAAKDPSVRPRAYYLVVLEFEDEGGLLRPGSSAKVRIDCGVRSVAGSLLQGARRLLAEKLWLW